eukprot:6214105-Pleurochrysis_carterae.AAC.4
MHRRLQVDATRLRALLNITAADAALSSLAHGTHSRCEACAGANATRQPHPWQHCKPFYAGRIIHADIAGPFSRSHRGGFVSICAHSRRRTQARLPMPSADLLPASPLPTLNRNSSTNARLVRSLHSDNTEELLVTEFAALL